MITLAQAQEPARNGLAGYIEVPVDNGRHRRPSEAHDRLCAD